MIRSMTGFGKAEVTKNNRKVTVEMKSVNHRYLDMNIRMPRKFNLYENVVRNIVKEYAIRGKIDIFINYEDMSLSDENLKFNETLAGEYYEYAKKIGNIYDIPSNISALDIMKCPEVLSMEDANLDEDELIDILKEAVTSACIQFTNTREAEGENLKIDLLDKLEFMKKTVEAISVRSPEVLNEYRIKLENKVTELLGNTQIEASRIATEVTLYADKMCVDEEIVRLQSHIDNMTKEFKKGGELGKRLDFLTQEMNRESNTILSKANDLDVTNLGIDLKTGIEKIREQIQNVE